MGWLGHEGSFYDDLTVEENLTFAARALDRPIDELDGVLERVGLGSRRRRRSPKQLSAGQRRRLGLAWLLLRRPELWLLDEPYASLDDDGRTFFDALAGRRRRARRHGRGERARSAAQRAAAPAHAR